MKKESTQNTVNNPKGAGTAARVLGQMQTQTTHLMKYTQRFYQLTLQMERIQPLEFLNRFQHKVSI